MLASERRAVRGVRERGIGSDGWLVGPVCMYRSCQASV